MARTVKVGSNKNESITVSNEEVGSATHEGGAASTMIEFVMTMTTPTDIVEKHAFNTDDGKTQYGSIIAPTYTSDNIEISYCYELRIWHHASFGSDSLEIITFPVTVVCPEGGFALSQRP